MHETKSEHKRQNEAAKHPGGERKQGIWTLSHIQGNSHPYLCHIFFGLSLIYKVTLISEPQKIQHTDKTTMSTTTNYNWNVNAYRFSSPQI